MALLGKGGGRVRSLVDEAIVVDSRSTSHIQEIQLAIQHLICEAVENQLLTEDSTRLASTPGNKLPISNG